jgi:hypothetical protein
MRAFLVLAVLFVAMTLSSSSDTTVFVSRIGASGPDVTENFDGAGYQTSWTEVTGNANEDYATAPAPLEGTQSLYMQTEAAQQEVRKSFTASDTVYVYMLFRSTTLPAGLRQQFAIKDGSGNTLMEAHLVPGPPWQWEVSDGVSVSSSGGATVSNGTTYHIWMEYTRGGGANSVHKFCWSTDGVKPTAGTAFINFSNGTSTGQASRFEIGTWSAGVSGDYIVDKFRLSRTAAFGSNPS